MRPCREEEEPEALRASDILLLAPVWRQEVAGSNVGESITEGAASRRFSSIESRRKRRKWETKYNLTIGKKKGIPEYEKR